jgi:hypothetical protein
VAEKTPYGELLIDPRWQKKRLVIFNRDGWKCRYCGDSTKTLHVHHEYYAKGKKPWEYPDNDLKTLCADCHSKAHGLDNDDSEFKEVFKQYLLGLVEDAFSDTCTGGTLLSYGCFTDLICEISSIQHFYNSHPTERGEAIKRLKLIFEWPELKNLIK